MWQGALGGCLLGIWCWGRTRRPVWVLGAEPCSIPNGNGEGCLLVAREFKFFKPFIQQVYMLSRYRQGIYLGTGDIAVKKIILLKKLRA